MARPQVRCWRCPQAVVRLYIVQVCSKQNACQDVAVGSTDASAGSPSLKSSRFVPLGMHTGTLNKSIRTGASFENRRCQSGERDGRLVLSWIKLGEIVVEGKCKWALPCSLRGNWCHKDYRSEKITVRQLTDSVPRIDMTMLLKCGHRT